MKKCISCGTEKKLSCFYKHPQMKQGRVNKCIDCCKDQASKRMIEKKDYIREYEKKRSNLPHRVLARKEYLKTDAGKVSKTKAGRKYRKEHPFVYVAHNMVGNAIRDGKLKKLPCEICKQKEAEAHHDDYGKPLDVRWLCKSHHDKWHKENKPINSAL